jgi:hypothetical protein
MVDKDKQVNARFIRNEPNFNVMFDDKLMTSVLQKDEIQLYPVLAQNLDEIYVCTISIFIMLNRLNEAKNYIHKAIEICKAFGLDGTLAKLLLIQLSLKIKHSSIAKLEFENESN